MLEIILVLVLLMVIEPAYGIGALALLGTAGIVGNTAHKALGIGPSAEHSHDHFPALLLAPAGFILALLTLLSAAPLLPLFSAPSSISSLVISGCMFGAIIGLALAAPRLVLEGLFFSTDSSSTRWTASSRAALSFFSLIAAITIVVTTAPMLWETWATLLHTTANAANQQGANQIGSP